MLADEPSLFERLRLLLDPIDPAELHGLLCGLLCLNADVDRDYWLNCVREALADGGEGSAPVDDLLVKLLEFGAAQMNALDGSVTPLLPDDDTPLRQRVNAISQWCDGLLYGLGRGEVELRGILGEESWEFLDDVTDIAQIGFDTDEAGEADEIAYTEVVEYLRVGLLMIQQDIQHSTTPSPAHLH